MAFVQSIPIRCTHTAAHNTEIFRFFDPSGIFNEPPEIPFLQTPQLALHRRATSNAYEELDECGK
jgi:hypothetical protein